MDEVRLGSRTLQPHRQLLVAGRREPLGKRALDIISVLAEARGEIVTKDELLEAVWPGVVVEENALQVHVVALRKALGPEADRLRTIRGVGYQLEIDGETVVPTSGPSDSAPPADQPTLSSHSTLDTRRASNPATALAAVWSKARSHRLAMAVSALLLALAGAWAVFGDDLGLRPQERIPVVVRELTATATGDPTEAALARGITDELIIRLRRIPDLRVATAGPDGSVAGGAFGAAYIVDGSIRRSGDQLRVTARLSSRAGEVLWSQTFDRPLADLLNVQEAIAAAIADALSVSFNVGANATEYGGTDNPEAFAAYLEAAAHGDEPDMVTQMRYLEHALAIDPNYVKALNALSVSYGIRSNVSATRKEALAWLAKMDEATARAVEANPDLVSGHVARGFYYANVKDLRSADREMQRAAELDDGIDPELRNNLAGYHLTMGRTQKALALIESIEMIDPIMRSNGGTRVWALTNAGKYEEAIELFDRAEAANPGGGNSLWAFWAHLMHGGETEAALFSEKYFGSNDIMDAYKVEEPAMLSMSEAELRLWAIRRFGDGNNTQLALRALLASYQGHSKLAVDLLRLSNERVGGFTVTVLWTPLLANTRKTDAFEKLVTDLGLVKLWREGGDWPDACRPVSATEISCN